MKVLITSYFTKLVKTKYALPIIALSGIIITVLIVKLQPQMTHDIIERPSVAVNYVEAKQYSLKPEIIGFGTIEPDLDLQAKAEVTGRVVYIHPRLKKGEIFKKGTLLLKIDDKDYLLQHKQAQADLLANKAKLTEMQLSIDNNKLELALAYEKLKVRQNEFSRKEKLSKTGSVSQSSVDAEKQNLLQQRQEIQKLINQKTTLPSQLKVTEAMLDIAQAKLEKSQRDITRTEIKIPFNGRISHVYTELDQYMATGSSLFDAFGLDKVIINAQFPLDQFSLFAKNFNRNKLKGSNLADGTSMSSVLASLQLNAIILDASGTFEPWQGKVERFSDNLDPKSRTVGVIISVEGSYHKMKPGSKPPLLAGMYMKVILQGQSKEFIALPRFTLHQGQVFKIDNDDKLQRITLENLQYQGSLLLLNEPLSVGDKIITSDLFPAVDGMSLIPIMDNDSQQQMNIWLGAQQ